MTAIRLLKAWKRWSIGHVFTDMPENQASLLIERGIAERQKAVTGAAKGAMRASRDYVTRGAKT